MKSVSSRGICTISTSSNGPRQDWLVCPYRALDDALLRDAARRLFDIPSGSALLVAPAPNLARDDVRKLALHTLASGGRVIVFLQEKLGGEISLSPTEKSPEVSFDTTLIEITGRDGELEIGKYGIVEVQTMDFHGSYRHAVRDLSDALRLHGSDFHRALSDNHGRWISNRVEGPNIANVFKRTFYQMMLKFQIGAQESSAGCALAIPAAVWDSWQRHLGKPDLQPQSDGTFRLTKPGGIAGRIPAWLYIFDIDATSSTTPNPITVQKIIGTDADSIAHFAVKVAPEFAIAEGGSASLLAATIRRRLGKWWPVLKGASVRSIGKARKKP